MKMSDDVPLKLKTPPNPEAIFSMKLPEIFTFLALIKETTPPLLLALFFV